MALCCSEAKRAEKVSAISEEPPESSMPGPNLMLSAKKAETQKGEEKVDHTYIYIHTHTYIVYNKYSFNILYIWYI